MLNWNEIKIGDTYEKEKDDGETVVYEVLDIKDGAIISRPKEDEEA